MQGPLQWRAWVSRSKAKHLVGFDSRFIGSVSCPDGNRCINLLVHLKGVHIWCMPVEDLPARDMKVTLVAS